MNERDCDVLILGAGVVGLACAWYLHKAGRRVTLIDQGQPGCGSSHGNCGTLTPSHAMPLAMPGLTATALKWMFKSDAPLHIKPRFDPALWRWLLAFRRRSNWADFHAATAVRAPFLMGSLALIRELVTAEKLDCEFADTGTLYVYRDAATFAKSQWMPRALSQAGVPVETLGGAEIEAREPVLKPGIVGGYLNTADAHLRPDRFVEELKRIVLAQGTRIIADTPVERLVRRGPRIEAVVTRAGDLNARDVVLALGAWSPTLVRPLGLRLPIQPGKGYSITYSCPKLMPKIPLVLKEPSVCVTAWKSGYRLGSTMEFSGYDTELNRTRLNALARGAEAYLHEPYGKEVREEWYGWRPMTPDDLPLIGRAPGIDNLCLATGHGMLGVSMSAMTGLLVSQLLTDTETTLDLAPFALQRFG